MAIMRVGANTGRLRIRGEGLSPPVLPLSMSAHLCAA